VALCLVLLALGVLRGHWRWRSWFVHRRTRGEHAPGRSPIDAIGLIEEHGGALPDPRCSLVGIYDHESPLRAGDRLEYAPKQSLARFVLGLGGLPVVRRMIVPRAIRSVVVVDLGVSLRAIQAPSDAGTGFEQLDFAIAVAEFVTDAWIASGAQVEILCGGLSEAVRLGPYYVSPGRGVIAKKLAEVARRFRARATTPASLDIEPGANVVWVGDLREDTATFDELAAWAQAHVEESGRFAAIRTRVRAECELVGIGIAGSPLRVVDRSTLSVADIEQQMARDDARLIAAAELAGFPMCVLDDGMTSEAVLERLQADRLLAG
jgi:hypothetical protein